ncbi:conserved hypothetical protein [Culex quinquefasciatus]|uniref:Uncharacterized protein n=1 Tax=Culex quinquefasciatus TaxID=7176 RepID=B0WK17_CULQU|nr:conserved hypothetical protein [Culex quinquefasciatus]|eukprot:XP_001849051.1 conserved hypothetical protein [Culex quinquefasciatus]
MVNRDENFAVSERYFGKVLEKVNDLVVPVALSCDIPTKHYKAMNCTEIRKADSECPERFECPSITNRDNSKCYFQGIGYSTSEQIPDELVSPLVRSRCNCQNTTSTLQFNCSMSNCHEKLNSIDHDNCIVSFASRDYCSGVPVCGQDRDKLATCIVDGILYRAGQTMSLTSDSCLVCLCHEGFVESQARADPLCHQVVCGFELQDSNEMYARGAPVYFGDRCCPADWKVAKGTDRVVKGGIQSVNKVLQCRFGELTLEVGDKLEPEVVDGFTYECACQIPPLVQCKAIKK